MRVGPCPGYAVSEIGDSGFPAVFESAGVGIAVAKFDGRIMQSNQTLRHQVLPAESAIYPVKPFQKAELTAVPEKALRDGASD